MQSKQNKGASRLWKINKKSVSLICLLCPRLVFFIAHYYLSKLPAPLRKKGLICQSDESPTRQVSRKNLHFEHFQFQAGFIMQLCLCVPSIYFPDWMLRTRAELGAIIWWIKCTFIIFIFWPSLQIDTGYFCSCEMWSNAIFPQVTELICPWTDPEFLQDWK